MKLFYSSGSCSLASHIMLEEAGAKFSTQRLNLREGEQRKPEYAKLNPKGKVPALLLDNGEVLTENPAILSYIADTHPAAGLLAKPGELARARAQEWLAWCAAGMHRDYGPVIAASRNKTEADPAAVAQLRTDYAIFDEKLAGKTFVLGEAFSLADAYTLVFTLWGHGYKFAMGENMLRSARALLQRAGVQRAVTTQELKFDFLG